MLGLEKGIVQIVPYDPAWQMLYVLEKAELCIAIGHLILDIQHIGSTAVPGCDAKPIIDIAISIADLGIVEACVPLLEQLGYEYKGENGILGRHYFQRGKPMTLFHIHMSTPEHSNLINNIRFRDYLLTHPEAVQAYCQLKHDLAARYPNNRLAYTDGKAEFIRSILELAK